MTKKNQKSGQNDVLPARLTPPRRFVRSARCKTSGFIRDTEIPVDPLAADIVSFVDLNHPGYTIVHAHIYTLCLFGAVTEVVAFMDGVGHVRLYFGASNNYLMKDQRVEYSGIPQFIIYYISANYSAYMPRHIALKLTLADNSTEYMIFLKVEGSGHKRIRIKEDGTFLCEQ